MDFKLLLDYYTILCNYLLTPRNLPTTNNHGRSEQSGHIRMSFSRSLIPLFIIQLPTFLRYDYYGSLSLD